MQQRVRQPYRGSDPSSARQLPILAALHAGFPTLFASIIHEKEEKVNTQFANIGIFLSIGVCFRPGACLSLRERCRQFANWRRRGPSQSPPGAAPALPKGEPRLMAKPVVRFSLSVGRIRGFSPGRKSKMKAQHTRGMRNAVRETENLYGDRPGGLSAAPVHPAQSGPAPAGIPGGGPGGAGGFHPPPWDIAAAVCPAYRECL